MSAPTLAPAATTTGRAGLWLGLAVAAALVLAGPEALSPQARATAGVALLMGIWWFTESVPVVVTGVLPFLLLPVFGVATPAEVAAQYASPVLFLVLGGALLGRALEKWGLHRRLALAVVARAGTRPGTLLFALMAATAFVSMWVHNAATTVMMLPIASALALAATRGGHDAVQVERFGTALIVAVAIAATIGGFGTPVGSAVNAVTIGIVEKQFGTSIGFAQWMAFAVPVVVAALPLAWLAIARIALPFRLPPLAEADVRDAVGTPGPWTPAERRVLAVLVATGLAWVALPWLGGLRLPSDAAVAIGAALLLFVLPAGGGAGREPLLAWPDARDAPWFLAVLGGAGLALAEAFATTGLAAWLAGSVRDVAPTTWLALLAAVVLACVLVTEVSTNLAAAATFVPIAGGLAAAAGHDPVLAALAAGLAAGWGYANPAGTPSNTLVLATGRVRARDLIVAGALVDAAGVVLIVVACATLAPLVIR